MKKFISILFSLLFIISLIGTIFIGILRNVILGSTFLTNVHALSTEEINLDNLKEMQKFSKKDFHEYFDQYLKEENLPTELIDEIVDQQNYKAILEDFVKDYTNYTLGNGEKPKIPEEKIQSILDDGIKAYEEKTGEKVDTELSTKIVKEVTKEVNNALEEISDNDVLNKSVQILFSDRLFFLLFGVTILLVILLIIVQKRKAFSYIGTSMSIAGLFAIIGFIKLKTFEIDLFGSFVIDIVNKGRIVGVSMIILGGLCIILQILFSKISKKEEKNEN